jgi:hypothetical protein
MRVNGALTPAEGGGSGWHGAFCALSQRRSRVKDRTVNILLLRQAWCAQAKVGSCALSRAGAGGAAAVAKSAFCLREKMRWHHNEALICVRLISFC